MLRVVTAVKCGRVSSVCVELEMNGLAMGNFLARPGLGWHGYGQSQAHGVTAAEGRESGFHAFGGGLLVCFEGPAIARQDLHGKAGGQGAPPTSVASDRLR